MNVLVTGAGGFIGSHLVDSQLFQGHRVTAFDLHTERLNHAKANPNLLILQSDLTDPDAVKAAVHGIDIIYHLASAHLDVSLPDSYYNEVNVTATLNLVKIAHQNDVQKFIHCSSVGVIGNVETPPADEKTPCSPTNIYEKTKLAGEQSVLEYAQQEAFPVVVVRPAWVYGPRCPRTEKLFKAIKKGRFFLFGNCKNLRHPIFVSDAVRGFELCADSNVGIGEVFILAGEKAVTVEELVDEIASVIGVKPPSIKFPLLAGEVAGSAMEIMFRMIGKAPPISRRSLDFFTKNNAYSIIKAEQRLNFHPHVNLRAGLLQTYEKVN